MSVIATVLVVLSVPHAFMQEDHATFSYDQKVYLWDAYSSEKIHLDGHHKIVTTATGGSITYPSGAVVELQHKAHETLLFSAVTCIWREPDRLEKPPILVHSEVPQGGTVPISVWTASCPAVIGLKWITLGPYKWDQRPPQFVQVVTDTHLKLTAGQNVIADVHHLPFLDNPWGLNVREPDARIVVPKPPPPYYRPLGVVTQPKNWEVRFLLDTPGTFWNSVTATISATMKGTHKTDWRTWLVFSTADEDKPHLNPFPDMPGFWEWGLDATLNIEDPDHETNPLVTIGDLKRTTTSHGHAFTYVTDDVEQRSKKDDAAKLALSAAQQYAKLLTEFFDYYESAGKITQQQKQAALRKWIEEQWLKFGK